MLIDRLHIILHQKCRVQTDTTILLGVSGGADSLCLMDALWRLGLRLHIAHLDHGLRPESGADAQAVARMARARGLPFTCQRAPVADHANRFALSIEAAARELRYRFLFAEALAVGAQQVMVAHTADDQVETVLFHLMRGSGLEGLGGMPYRALPNSWSQDIALVRPLLDFWRVEIESYLSENNLTALQDPTNQDPAYFRNRLRHQALPYLEELRPGFRRALLRLAAIAQDENELVGEWAEAAWAQVLAEQRPRALALRRQALADQPLALQRRLLRRAALVLNPGGGLDFAATERARSLLAGSPAPIRIDLTNGLWIRRQDDLLWLAAWDSDLPGADWPQLPAEPQVLDVPGRASLQSSWMLDAQRVEDDSLLERFQTNRDPYQAWLDADSLQLPLLVRARLPGDRLSPLGMPDGRIKISDLMINRRLPEAARAAWPVVFSGGEAAWVPGLHMGHRFRLTARSRRAVHLWLFNFPADTGVL